MSLNARAIPSSTRRQAAAGTISLAAKQLLQRKCACGGTPAAGGECEECRGKRLQRKIDNREPNESLVPPVVHEVLRSAGQPLDAQTRAFMEPRFGHDFSNVAINSNIRANADLAIVPADDRSEHEADAVARRVTHLAHLSRLVSTNYDFSQVRVHADAQAARSAQAVDADAYTVGNHIVFGPGRYQPESAGGRRLLAHELTHVIQQSDGSSVRLQRSLVGCQEILMDPGAASFIPGRIIHRIIQNHFMGAAGQGADYASNPGGFGRSTSV